MNPLLILGGTVFSLFGLFFLAFRLAEWKQSLLEKRIAAEIRMLERMVLLCERPGKK